jgi:hypothetical protein
MEQTFKIATWLLAASLVFAPLLAHGQDAIPRASAAQWAHCSSVVGMLRS